MKIICAWCQRVLVNGDPERVSHSICPTCLEREMREEK